MTEFHVVTLWPYNDGTQADYQFDTPDEAQAFADRVNALPAETRSYIHGSGTPDPVTVWTSRTYESANEAWETLTGYLPEEVIS